MLVVTRKSGEYITIEPEGSHDPDSPVGRLFANGPIKLWVAQIKGGHVKLGIDAHPDLNVVREELLEKSRQTSVGSGQDE
ncbi:MAG TPA: carbon storage regulator [Gammaproteobacteria bacterium]|nr:carbon storage regulator [Gammaproteobacteria bacterium]